MYSSEREYGNEDNDTPDHAKQAELKSLQKNMGSAMTTAQLSREKVIVEVVD